MDVEKTIEFLLNNQTKHDERRLDHAMVALAEAGIKADQRMEQLGRRVDQMVSANNYLLP